jgi:hypothetical protein
MDGTTAPFICDIFPSSGSPMWDCVFHRCGNWCSSCEITYLNLVCPLLMPAKTNCASAWANQTAGHSAQNGGSRTDTLDTSAGAELSVVCIVLCRSHQCRIVSFTDVSCVDGWSVNHVLIFYTNIYYRYTEHTTFSLKICMLLVEEGIPFARLALRVSSSLSVCW